MSERIEYRCYVFVSSLLSSGSKMAQVFHAGVELCKQYLHGDNYNIGKPPALDAVVRYANVDKTVIVLDGGNNRTMNELCYTLRELSDELALPMSYFYEDEDTLNKMLTSIAIIVPSTIYDNKLQNPSTLLQAPHHETKLAAILQTHYLAR